MGKIGIAELVEKANGYVYGMISYGDTMAASIVFNEAKIINDNAVFQQINQDDVKIRFKIGEIESIKDESREGSICYKLFMKSGVVINIFLFNEKGAEAQTCHAIYGTYDDYLKELDLSELESMINKAKKAIVTVSDESLCMKNTYEHIRLEDTDIIDGSRKLVFFNGEDGASTDKVAFTLYEDALNDIWLMISAGGWEGLKLRLYSQPFTEVRISLIYK